MNKIIQLVINKNKYISEENIAYIWLSEIKKRQINLSTNLEWLLFWSISVLTFLKTHSIVFYSFLETANLLHDKK